MSNNSINNQHRALEAQLGGMVPAAVEIDRDRLMYRLGWEAAVSSLGKVPSRRAGYARYAWPAATAMATAASIVLVVMVVMVVRGPQPTQEGGPVAQRPEVEAVEPKANPPASQPEKPDEIETFAGAPPSLPWPFRNASLNRHSYLSVRHAVLEMGVNALPPSEAAATFTDEGIRAPATMRSLLNEYLPTPPPSSPSQEESDEEPLGRSLPNQEHLS